MFVRGTDNALYHKYWNGPQWIDWENLGGVLTSAPAVASWANNRLDVFVKGTDNALYHKYWNGSQWSDWESLGGTLTSGPAAVSGDRTALMYLQKEEMKILSIYGGLDPDGPRGKALVDSSLQNLPSLPQDRTA